MEVFHSQQSMECWNHNQHLPGHIWDPQKSHGKYLHPTANLFYFVYPSAFKSMKPLFWLKAINAVCGNKLWEMLL